MIQPWLTPEPTRPYADLAFLIIDDTPLMRQWLRQVVTATGGRKIDLAADFNAALQKLKSGTRYDVVLCDYILNDTRDGQQLLEEARRNNLLPADAIWFMVTGESSYHQVFSAAELLPDDYLIKPFTPAVLQERVEKALKRARALSEPNRRLYAGQYAECVQACAVTLAQAPQYASEIQRIAGEALLRGGEHDRARTHFLTLLQAGKDLPWVRLGLARANFHLDKTDEAQDILELLILDSPEYLQAHDWMARIQEKRGNPEVAKEILAETLKKNPKALWRHREIVRVALETDDPATAAQAYEALHQHGRGSTFLTPGDFSGYALLLASKPIAEARNKVRQLTNNLRDFFGRENRFDFARAATDYSRAAVQGDAKAEAAAYQAMKAAARKVVESGDKMALLHAALQQNDTETAEGTVRELFQDHDGNERMARQILHLFPPRLAYIAERAQISAHEEMRRIEARAVDMARQGDLEGAVREFDRLARERPSLSLLYNAGVAVAKWIENAGWSVEKGMQLDRHLRAMQAIDPGSPKLRRLQEFRAHLPMTPRHENIEN